jgi:hypothetical protein
MASFDASAYFVDHLMEEKRNHEVEEVEEGR